MPPHFMTQWAYTPSSTYTVGTTIGICTTQNCPTYAPPLLTQWAHTSSFYDTVGLCPIILWHSGPIPHHLLTQLAPPLTSTLHKLCNPCSCLTYTVGPYLLILWLSGPVPPFTYTVGTTLAIFFTQTVQPQFLPCLHNGPIPPHDKVGLCPLILWHSRPIPPHLMTQWTCTPSSTYTVGPTTSFSCSVGYTIPSHSHTVGPYPLIC